MIAEVDLIVLKLSVGKVFRDEVDGNVAVVEVKATNTLDAVELFNAASCSGVVERVKWLIVFEGVGVVVAVLVVVEMLAWLSTLLNKSDNVSENVAAFEPNNVDEDNVVLVMDWVEGFTTVVDGVSVKLSNNDKLFVDDEDDVDDNDVLVLFVVFILLEFIWVCVFAGIVGAKMGGGNMGA